MDKDNQFRSCGFYMQADDVCHIRVKDLVGAGFTVELNDADGTAEDETEVTPYGSGTPIKYGALYNWYAATDVRNICSTGWHVSTKTEWETLRQYLDPVNYNNENLNDAGGKLREYSPEFWDHDDGISTNLVQFNGRGSGAKNGHYLRDPLYTIFDSIKLSAVFWSIDEIYPGSDQVYSPTMNLDQSSLVINNVANFKWSGNAIRPFKDSTTLTHGQTGTYTGNDGKVYRTICIGSQEWLADNLAETKYRDGSDIPLVTDNSAWTALTTGAMCYYNNDISYA